jgi:hypothetical protein
MISRSSAACPPDPAEDFVHVFVCVDVSVSDFPRDLWSVGHHKQIDVGHDTQFEWQEHSSCYA